MQFSRGESYSSSVAFLGFKASEFMLIGANTNRDEGLPELELTAERGQFLKPFAKLLLAVAALRRRDDENAKFILGELHREFPHKLLIQKTERDRRSAGE